MKKRTLKLISIILAAAMVFSTNTITFAEESHPDKIVQGMTFTYDNEKAEYVAKTGISYELDPTVKKAKTPDVATITDVDNPVSWNNHYAAGLINTVLFGTNNEDTWLNNSSTVTVSDNYDPADPEYVNYYAAPLEYREPISGMKYAVVPVRDDSVFLFVGYGLVNDPSKDIINYCVNVHVEGYDDPEPQYDGLTIPATVPVTEWDGRKIEFNKSGKYKWTAARKEALDVKVALVKYENGTLTEIPGAEASVKVDKKTQKSASMLAEYHFVDKHYTGYKPGFGEGEWILGTRNAVVREYKMLSSELPFFTLSAKIKGNEGKAYAKDLKTALKNKEYNTYHFGIYQHMVEINDFDLSNYFKDAYIIEKDKNGIPTKYTISAGNIKTVEEAIAKDLTGHKYSDKDDDEQYASDLKVTKFTGKKAKIAILGMTGERKLKRVNNGYEKGHEVSSLKAKTDFYFSDGFLAGTPVSVLELTGPNVVYRPLGSWYYLKKNYNEYDTSLMGEYPNYDGDLGELEYKYAFRMSPIENSKLFRMGIYHSDNIGFVYEAE